MAEVSKLPDGFFERYGPRALILGGSEGIGASFAEQLAAGGFGLTLVARSDKALESTAARLRSRFAVDVDCQALDLTQPGIEQTARQLVNARDYGLVIYNAGATHGVGLLVDQPVEQALNLVRLNCLGTVAFAHAALSAMRTRNRGGLLMMSSMSALTGSGFVAAYAASKSFEIILAEGLHWEMQREGIDVLCAVASLTDTPAMRRSGMLLDAVPEFVPMEPETVASGALRNLGKTPVWFAVGETVVRSMEQNARADRIHQASTIAARLWGVDG